MKPTLSTFAQILLIAAAGTAAGQALAQTADAWRRIPTNPIAGEEFVIQVLGPTSGNVPAFARGTTRVTGNTVVINTDLGAPPAMIPSPAPQYFSTAAVTLPAVDLYTAVRETRDGSVTYVETLGTFPVAPPRPAATPLYRTLSGTYFSDDEVGSGVNIIQSATGQLFSAWFTYRPSPTQPAESLWLTVPTGKWVSTTEFRGVLYETRGTTLDVAFDPARFAARPVGVVTLRFVSATEVDFEAQLSLDASFELITKQKRLHRTQF